jgi:hypothetical protein
MDLIDDIAAMFSNAAWHAAYTRMGWGKDKSAAATKDEFEARYKYIADSGELSKRLCTHLKWMAWNAAWFTANTRAGNHQDAAKDKVGFERQARAVLGDIHRGVSLGGWLLLQRWMCAGVFSGVSERDAWDEFSLCAHLGRELAERRIIAWRDSWISRYERKRMHLCMLACIQACLHVPASRHISCAESILPANSTCRVVHARACCTCVREYTTATTLWSSHKQVSMPCGCRWGTGAWRAWRPWACHTSHSLGLACDTLTWRSNGVAS